MNQKLFAMKKSILLFILCLLLIGFSSLAQPGDEKEVADRVERLRKAMLNVDKNTLEELTAEQLSYGHSGGLVEDKNAFVSALVTKKTVFTAINLSDQTIKLAGDAAIVRNHFTGATNNNNVPANIDIFVLMVWQKQNGTWKLLARQAAKIPEVKPN